MAIQQTLTIKTQGRGIYPITDQISALVAKSKIEIGLCHTFIRHTSASLIICENADPNVLSDLEAFISRLVVDGDPLFKHTLEGPDDMAAHIRSVLTQTELTLPISNAQLALGTWQGVFLYEHRYQHHARKLILTIV